MNSGASVDVGGLPGPIAETLGAFEPRFFGVSLLLENPAVFEAWASLVGLTDKGEAHLPLFDTVCLQTALDHERRHFHDALISPFANTIMRARMMAAFSGLKLLNRGVQLGANRLLLPASTWMEMDATERAAWLATVKEDEDTEPIRPLPIPYRGQVPLEAPFASGASGLFDISGLDLETEALAFGKAAIESYDLATAIMRGPADLLDDLLHDLGTEGTVLKAVVAPRNIFEASALAVQLQSAWTNFSEEAFFCLYDYLETSNVSYAVAFRAISSFSTPPDGHPTMEAIATVAGWCLMGDGSDRAGLDPSLRFIRLLRASDGEGVPPGQGVADLWDQWDRLTGSKPWRTNVTDMRASTARTVNNYVRIRNADGKDEPDFGTLLETYHQNQLRATDLLLDDPDSYILPVTYLENQERLPTPLISVELGEDFIAPVDTFPENDAVRVPRSYEKDGVRGWNRIVIDLHKPPRPGFLDAALNLEFACKMSDLALSNEPIRLVDREAILGSFRSLFGLSPLYVF